MSEQSGNGVPLPLWDDDAFRARVAQLAEQRKMSIAHVCKEARLSASYFARAAGKSGRSVEALLSLAQVLEISLVELIGATNHHAAMPTEQNLTRLALVAEIAAYLYVALGARPQIPAGVETGPLISEIMRRIDGAAGSAQLRQLGVK